MKKFIAVILAAMLMLTAFSACSGTKEQSSVYDTPVMKVGDMQYTLNDINYMYVMCFFCHCKIVLYVVFLNYFIN